MSDQKPREWAVQEWREIVERQADSDTFFVCFEDCIEMLSAYDFLAQKLKEAEAELLNTKELSSKLVEENAALKAEVKQLESKWFQSNKERASFENELTREQSITAMLREAIQFSIKQLMTYRDNFLDFEVPECARGPKELEDLRGIEHHLIGSLIEVDNILAEENAALKAEVERLGDELKSWNAISEACGRSRAEIYGMSHQLKAGKYANKPQQIPCCDCSNPDNLKIHDEICDILEGNAWNENEVCTASVGIWAALEWYERLKVHAEKLAEAIGQTIPGLSSFDFEERARQWATFSPNRQAQHFYEGALMARTIVRQAQGEALAAYRKEFPKPETMEGKE